MTNSYGFRVSWWRNQSSGYGQVGTKTASEFLETPVEVVTAEEIAGNPVVFFT
jgi:hypothetical protein